MYIKLNKQKLKIRTQEKMKQKKKVESKKG